MRPTRGARVVVIAGAVFAATVWMLARASSGLGADGGAKMGAETGATAGAPARVLAPTPTPMPAPTPASASTPTLATRAGARALHAQGLSRLKSGQIDEAARLFTRALDSDPDNVGLMTDLGFALGKLGRREPAEAMLRAAIAKDPRRCYAYVNLADLLADDPSRWERRDHIIAFLEKGLEAVKDDDKGHLLVLLRLANFERVVGRTAAARARLEPLLSPGAGAGASGAPLARAQRKRVLDLLEAIALDERAQALEDWPTPPPSRAQSAEADGAAAALDAGRGEEARARLDLLVRRAPSWPRARLLRARALEALGRVDEAVRDLEITVNLAPSSAHAWRALGRLLATQGGALEADRADEALRNAQILEPSPSWSELAPLRAQLARRRAALAAAPVTPDASGPTEHARALYQEAEEWIEGGDPAGLGRDLVAQALAESPGYVEAAVTAYALTGQVSPDTVTALWDDGPSLWALATGIRRLGKDGAVDRFTPPWIDRAVALDVQEARFARALARAGAGDKMGALSDLMAYVAREPRPVHLAEARALRAGLAGGEGRPSPELLARIRLLEGRPDAALAALGGACTADRAGDRLRALGLVHEYADQREAARRCYELASAVGDQTALVRLARLDARLPDAELRGADRAALEHAAGQGIAAAHWALSRLAAAAGDEATALVDADRALALAQARDRRQGQRQGDGNGQDQAQGTKRRGEDADGDGDGDSDGDAAAGASDVDDLWLAPARATRDGLAAARREADRSERQRRRRLAGGAAALAGLLLAIGLRRRLRGRTVAMALARQPALFPEVGRAVAEIRHDVLKHRAGVLGLVANPAAPRAELHRAMTAPQPTSVVVAAIYDRLAQAALGNGVPLRPLTREPTFGPLVRDLARAETLLARARAETTRHDATDVALLAIDVRLRGSHADRLDHLLQLGPRTRLDAGEVGSWIGAVEAATRRAGDGWAATAMLLGDQVVEFPVERRALHAIFANLLRNAQAAVAGQDDARVIIRVDRERDVTGRQVAQLMVGDSATAALTLEAIEARESGRGLAIVRDLVRQWRGHLIVRSEAAPFIKQIGACFPL